MKTKLKYLKLFEGISQSDIPYSNNIYNKLNISIPSDLTELPEIYNQLTNEIGGYISIHGNSNLTHISGFNNLTKIEGKFLVESNEKLEHITGFNSLTKIGERMNICGNLNLTHIDSFKNLTEIGDNLTIENNQELTHITGFNKLTEIGDDVFIGNNPNLTNISGFNNLTKIKWGLFLYNNPKLIPMSIPHTIIKSVDYVERGIYGEIKYISPVDFINNPDMIRDCIDRFDPSIYPDIVVKQIIENLELWGVPKTIKTILDHILSKGDYWDYIPESFKQYVDDHYHHLYNPKYKNTGARGIAKMNTGRYLGMF